MNSKNGMIDLPKISNVRGNLTFIEGKTHIPFDIKRVYYLYDVPGGETRGGHAHIGTEQVMIAVSGSFDVVLENGRNARRVVTLNRSYYGLLISKMTWRELENFSSGAVCLVLASTRYDEGDYLRDYEDFIQRVGNEKD